MMNVGQLKALLDNVSDEAVLVMFTDDDKDCYKEAFVNATRATIYASHSLRPFIGTASSSVAVLVID